MIASFQAKTTRAADHLATVRIVPVLVLNSEDEGLRIGEILMQENLKAAEITFRTQAAESVIRKMSIAFPELYIGAGTILNETDLKRAVDAGAKFGVAPGFNPITVESAIRENFAFAPGIATPSELEQAYAHGCRFLKVFPAEAIGGAGMISAIAAPYKHLGIRFMPTGGVTTSNVADYLAIPQVAAVGGTWLGRAKEIEAGDWNTIRKTVRAAVELIVTHNNRA